MKFRIVLVVCLFALAIGVQAAWAKSYKLPCKKATSDVTLMLEITNNLDFPISKGTTISYSYRMPGRSPAIKGTYKLTAVLSKGKSLAFLVAPKKPWTTPVASAEAWFEKK